MGRRKDLVAEIAKTSGILQHYVNNFAREADMPREFRSIAVGVAEKLAWAAKRQSSRCEDKAYCLLGLFDINLPLFYGEGDKAFRHLQEEIIRSSSDESIFAWGSWDEHITLVRGVLCPSMSLFGEHHIAHPDNFNNVRFVARSSYSITNQGLEFRVPKSLSCRSEFLLPLNCKYYRDGTVIGAYAIRLVKHVDQRSQ
jgi:hypothetical protein